MKKISTTEWGRSRWRRWMKENTKTAQATQEDRHKRWQEIQDAEINKKPDEDIQTQLLSMLELAVKDTVERFDAENRPRPRWIHNAFNLIAKAKGQ